MTNPFNETTAYEYSPGGRVKKRVLGNDCVTYYSYDAIGQVSKVDNRAPDLSVISSFEYERDPRGNPTKIVREDGYTTYYEYDAKSQLTRETHRESGGQTVYAWEWDYDSCGNRSYQIFNGAQTDYTYNLANQLTEETSGGVTTYYKYDRSGNTISKEEVAGATYYHWDHGNHLTQIDQPGNVHSYFTYDGDGKRKTKQDAAGFTRFVYQGPDMLGLLQERDADDELVAQYTMGNGLEAMRRGGTSRFYHHDWLGSTFELTDGNGAVTDEYLYDAWGNGLATSGATVNPHRYVGRFRYSEIPGTGLYHVGHRQLDPVVGRFLTMDPIRDGTNWFAFVASIPTGRVDPEGMQPKEPKTWLRGELRETMTWLDRNRRRADTDCWPERIKKIRKLMNLIYHWGKDVQGYHWSPAYLRNWLEGRGQPKDITYKQLLSDYNFVSAHQVVWRQAYEAGCLEGKSASNRAFQAGIFLPDTDLFNTFHRWDELRLSAQFQHRGDACICEDGRQGHWTVVTFTYTFFDVYDWEKGEATPMPGTGFPPKRFRQDWALELAQCHRRVWPHERVPKDIQTEIPWSGTKTICCPDHPARRR